MPPKRGHVRATLRPGCVVVLVDVSESGALVEAPRPLRPGARVHLQVATTTRRIATAASVLRCMVWSLDAEDGAVYRGALCFDHRVDWGWAEATRRVQGMPEHRGPTGTGDGNSLPGESERRIGHRA